ncbi:MAG: hypothetical protein LKE37_11140 [Atopobiaceae bacterium]|nr:hypothetical protein [Atopobiaceae bacterium]
MNTSLFRKKSLDRLSSPDQLNDYIRVTNPAVWLVLAAVVLIFAMLALWMTFGEISVSATCVVIARDGTSEVYVPASDAGHLKEGLPVEMDNIEIGTITSVPDNPIQITSSFDSNAKSIGHMSTGDFYYVCTTDASFANDGVYQVKVIYNRVSPLQYLMAGEG